MHHKSIQSLSQVRREKLNKATTFKNLGVLPLFTVTVLNSFSELVSDA
jgi:hypothetical protein